MFVNCIVFFFLVDVCIGFFVVDVIVVLDVVVNRIERQWSFER